MRKTKTPVTKRKTLPNTERKTGAQKTEPIQFDQETVRRANKAMTMLEVLADYLGIDYKTNKENNWNTLAEEFIKLQRTADKMYQSAREQHNAVNSAKPQESKVDSERPTKRAQAKKITA